jgi:hypothetical protein
MMELEIFRPCVVTIFRIWKKGETSDCFSFVKLVPVDIASSYTFSSITFEYHCFPLQYRDFCTWRQLASTSKEKHLVEYPLSEIRGTWSVSNFRYRDFWNICIEIMRNRGKNKAQIHLSSNPNVTTQWLSNLDQMTFLWEPSLSISNTTPDMYEN